MTPWTPRHGALAVLVCAAGTVVCAALAAVLEVC